MLARAYRPVAIGLSSPECTPALYGRSPYELPPIVAPPSLRSRAPQCDQVRRADSNQ
jgi:hypothetical protein